MTNILNNQADGSPDGGRKSDRLYLPEILTARCYRCGGDRLPNAQFYWLPYSPK